MINIELLKESVYKDDYFSKSSGKLIVHNEKRVAMDVLSYVVMQTKGTFICLNNKILKESSNIYKTDNKDEGRISFRRDCDGICLLEVDGRNILLIIEVKSGFNEIKKKAFEQLVASYIKTRSILQSIEGYNPDEYEEIGLLVSYPPTGKRYIPATSMIDIKKEVIAPSSLDRLNNVNVARLRVNQEVILNLSDYMIDSFHVNQSLYNPTLHVKHVSVTDQVGSETIDLDSYL